MKTNYIVSWDATWAREEITFADMDKAVEFAKMKRSMNYKNVKLEKAVITEIEF